MWVTPSLASTSIRASRPVRMAAEATEVCPRPARPTLAYAARTRDPRRCKVRATDKLYIDGAWVPSTGKGTIDVINSTTEEVMGKIPEGTKDDADRAVRAARAAFPGWSQTS